MITRKRAFELSIMKWEATVNGEKTPVEVRLLLHDCGLCEKYFHTHSKYLVYCDKCPIRPKLHDYDDIDGSGCWQKKHLFYKWFHNRTPKTSQKVLDLIISKQ
jgi:hypothetical protein